MQAARMQIRHHVEAHGTTDCRGRHRRMLEENMSYLVVLVAAEIILVGRNEPSLRVDVSRLTRKGHLPPNGE